MDIMDLSIEVYLCPWKFFKSADKNLLDQIGFCLKIKDLMHMKSSFLTKWS
jgi:hypothetical protein